MISSWIRRRAVKNEKCRSGTEDLTIPNQLHSPISLHLTYDFPPKHKIPLTSYEVSHILAGIQDSKQRSDQERCAQLVAKVKESAKESDGNKRCLVANAASTALSAAFEAFSATDLLGEILSAVMMLTPALDDETRRNLWSPASLRRIVWLLRFGDLAGKRNAVLAVRSLVSSDKEKVEEVVETEGALEALMKTIEEPICPTTTKASLLAIYYLVTPIETTADAAAVRRRNKKAMAAMSFTEMGLVEIVLEMAVDSDRSTCEKALGVLDGICSHDEARDKARESALFVPLLVKKLLRVSELATEFSVSILSKIIRVDNDDDDHDDGDRESAVVEALGAGAFQKLLLLLQIGCDEVRKEKVSELLKLLNAQRSRIECVDSLDFKHLKRPF